MISPPTIAHHGASRQPKNYCRGDLLDTAFFQIILCPLLPFIKPALEVIYSVRWQLSRPLQIWLFPRWFPVIDLPFIRDLKFLTLGEIILALPLIILILSGYYFTFVVPDVVRSGEIASYAIYATFLTANKSNSLITFVFGIPFERMIPFHNLSSWATILLSFSHGYVAYAYSEGGTGEIDSTSEAAVANPISWDDDGRDDDSSGSSGDSGDRRLDSDDSQYALNGSNPNLLRFLFDGENNLTGTLLVLSIILLISTSMFPSFRRAFFDVWLWMHVLLAICVVTFCKLHSVDAILFVAIWWALDLAMRYIIMAGCRYPRKANLELVSRDVVKISFIKPRGFQYNPGQYVQIALLDLGLLAFHPISIASAPQEQEVTLYVRALGDWSRKLVKLAQNKKEASIFIEGPYGSLSLDLDDDNRYQMAVLVSGGIGVTHCQSVARTLLNDYQYGRQLKHLRFVWAVREVDILPVLEPLENMLSEMTDLELTENSESTQRNPASGDIVETNIFLTRKPSKSSKLRDHQGKLSYGRPDLQSILADVKEKAEASRVTHVAVFGCGPQALITALKEECRQQSKSLCEPHGVQFDCHVEIFDF